MDYKEAVAILRNLIEKHPLNAQEKEALQTAIGLLVWSSLAKSRTKAQKALRQKRTEW